MDSNENFKREMEIAPNCHWDEGVKLQSHFINCVIEWLTQKRLMPSQLSCNKYGCYGWNGCIDELLEDL